MVLMVVAGAAIRVKEPPIDPRALIVGRAEAEPEAYPLLYPDGRAEPDA